MLDLKRAPRDVLLGVIAQLALQPLLPDYWWSAKAKRYYRRHPRVLFVKRAKIVSLLGDRVDDLQEKLTGLADDVLAGTVSPAVGIRQMGEDLKQLHLSNRALGAGGWDRLGFRDYGKVGGRMKAERRRLRAFMEELAAGDLSPAQARARVNMYIGGARIQFFEAEAAANAFPAKKNRVVISKRFLGKADHCVDCLRYHKSGWQLVGVLPVPGIDSVCGNGCRCTIQYHEVPADQVDDWLGTRKRA